MIVTCIKVQQKLEDLWTFDQMPIKLILFKSQGMWNHPDLADISTCILCTTFPYCSTKSHPTDLSNRMWAIVSMVILLISWHMTRGSWILGCDIGWNIGYANFDSGTTGQNGLLSRNKNFRTFWSTASEEALGPNDLCELILGSGYLSAWMSMIHMFHDAGNGQRWL